MSDRFVCGVCHRERPKTQRAKGQARCRDRASCMGALRRDLSENWRTANTSQRVYA